jgi:peptidoglycan/xylan/chitin deacetylase (PgdA/CDA1 family)
MTAAASQLGITHVPARRFGSSGGFRERLREAISRRLARAVVTARVPLALDRAAVSFTFDDIPETAATCGARLLEERGVRGTFYVCGGLLGHDLDLYRLAGLEQVKALSEAGHEIGCHTAHHHSAARVPRHEYLRDVERNAELLEAHIGKFATFAYPYGAIALGKKFALQSRFAACRGIHGGMAVGSYDRGRLDATALEDATVGEREVEALIDAAVARKAWLTFYAHDVSERPSRFGVSPRLLAHAIDVALKRGCLVDTVAGIVARNEEARRRLTP